MSAQIIDRGRGPEIKGTRVTVYRIMDFQRGGSDPDQIAAALDLTIPEVDAALAYIVRNQEKVEREYERILARSTGTNPPSVEVGGASSKDELKQRIRTNSLRETNHADPAR